MPNWLGRAVGWITYHLGLGESLAEVEQQFEESHGALSQEELDAAIDTALTAAEVDERLATLPMDEPMSAALQDVAPPAALVLVRATGEYEDSKGNKIYREFTQEFPWDTPLSQVYDEMVDLADQDEGRSASSHELVGVTLRDPIFFPRY